MKVVGYRRNTGRIHIFSIELFESVSYFLTLENRSFYYPITRTIRYQNRLIPLIIVITLSMLLLFLAVPPLRKVFDLGIINLDLFLISMGTAFLSVIWAEGYKYFRRKR